MSPLFVPHHDLGFLATHIGHVFHHHHAQEDAEAAGRVLLAMMTNAGVQTPQDLIERANQQPGDNP